MIAAAAALGLALAILVPKWLEERTRAAEETRARIEAQRREQAMQELNRLWAQVATVREWSRQAFRTAEDIRSEFSRAASDVSTFTDSHPEMPQGWYVRARACAYLGELDRAEEALAKATAIAPGFAPGWTLLGQIRLERYMRMLRGSPEEQETRTKAAAPALEEARTALQRGWSAGSEAASVSRWGLARTAEDAVVETLASAFHEYYVKRNAAEAVAILLKAQADGPSELYALWLGVWSTRRDDRLKWVEEALRIAPHFAAAYLERGTHRLVSGDAAGAASDFTKAIEHDPGMAEAWSNRGLAWRAQRRFEQAIVDWTRAIKLNPRYARAYTNRGAARRARGDRTGALEDYTKAIEINPQQFEAFYNRANARLPEDLAGAVEDYSKALAINPKHAQSLSKRGIARRMLGEHDRAIEDLTAALAMEPRDALSLYNRALARRARSDIAGAIADLEKVLDVAPPGGPQREAARRELDELRQRPR